MAFVIGCGAAGFLAFLVGADLPSFDDFAADWSDSFFSLDSSFSGLTLPPSLQLL